MKRESMFLGGKFFLILSLVLSLSFLQAQKSIDTKDYEQAQDVLNRYTLKRSLPRLQVKSSLSIYEYMFDHLDFVAKVVRFLELGTYQIRLERGDFFELDDQKGLVTTFRLIYHRQEMRVYLSQGVFQAPFNLKVAACGLIVVRYKPTTFGEVDSRSDRFC
jgi:hypothetical protein